MKGLWQYCSVFFWIQYPILSLFAKTYLATAPLKEECDSFDLKSELGVQESAFDQVWIDPKPVKLNGLLESSLLPKFSLVFGIPIFGFDGVTDERLRLMASVLAEFLDNDSDGKPDNEDLVDVLRTYQASLVLTETENKSEEFFDLVKLANCSNLYDLPGIIVSYESSRRVGKLNAPGDRTLGFITDFLVQFGYPYTYNPDRSLVARKVEDYFKIALKRGWIKTEIVGTDRHTLRQEYQKGLLKSVLGEDVEECKWWGIWTLCTADDLRRRAPVLYQTLKSSINVPDGVYVSPALMS